MKKSVRNYTIVEFENDKGRIISQAVYNGKYYEISLDEKSLNNFRLSCFLLLVAMFALQILAGFINNQGMYAFYVALPYVFSFHPLFLISMSIFRLPKEKRRYRDEEIGLSFKRLKWTSICFIVLIGMTMLGEGIFLFWHFIGVNLGSEAFFLAIELLTIAAAAFMHRSQKNIVFSETNLSEEVS